MRNAESGESQPARHGANSGDRELARMRCFGHAEPLGECRFHNNRKEIRPIWQLKQARKRGSNHKRVT